MKIFTYILVLFVALLCAICAICFTSFGNNFIAKQVEKRAKDSGVELKFSKFKLEINQVSLATTINGEINLDLDGKISLFSQSFDLDYNVTANSLNMTNMSLLKPILVNGKAKGRFKDFDVNGLGEIFGSDISFLANIKDYKPFTAQIDAKKLEISEILAFIKQKNYAKGHIDIVADIKDENGKRSGKADILLNNIVANSKEILRDFNITLPSDFSVKGTINSVINDNLIAAKSELSSQIFTLNTKNTSYEISKNAINSDFYINLNNLSRLEPIIKQKLNGTLKASGDVELLENRLVNLKTIVSGLGGTIDANLKGEKLNAKANDIKLKELFLLLGQKPVANATINSDIILDTKNLDGNIALNLKNGEFDSKNMSELVANFPNGVKFNATSDIKITKNIANFSAEILSDLVNLKDITGNFDTKSGDLKADLNANISDLRKLKFLSNKELFGKIDINIKAQKSGDNLKAMATSKLFNGDLKALLENDSLNANLSKFSFKELTDMLGQSNYYNGKGNAELKYDIKSQNGVFEVDIVEGRLPQNDFTNTIKAFSGRDITNEIYKNGYVVGTIKKGVVNFDMSMTAQRSDINATSATFNTITDAINIPLNFRYEKTDAKIDITGTSKEPKYSVKSEYLKEKLIEGLDKIIDKNSNKDAIKGLIKGLF
ncbi:hypothetical protein [Campylobacter mucosalis]|uniref:hypothetical protein n=1 Tax=Campylobacter mucosalis TaxID=202 RepID=UPI00147066DF|nr:hypothetical protein [Campylobacter mucosalis]